MIIAISGKIGSGKDTVTKIIQFLELKTTHAHRNLTFEKFLSKDEAWRSTWENKKFAGKLKQIVSILTGIPVKDLEKEEVKNSYLGEEWNYYWCGKERLSKEQWQDRYYSVHKIKLPEDDLDKKFLVRMTVRQLLQEMGTDAMRNVIHPNIYINALFADYKEGLCPCERSRQDGAAMMCFMCEGGKHPNWIISDMRFPNELEAVKKRDGITIRINRSIGVANVGEVSYQNDLHSKNQHPSETSLDDAVFDWYINNNGTIEELIEKVKFILEKEGILNGNR